MLYYPEKCMRDREDCQPLSSIVSDPEFGLPQTFICCGENDGSCRIVEQDRYRLCVKTNEGVDEIRDVDQADITDQITVLSYALSMILRE